MRSPLTAAALACAVAGSLVLSGCTSSKAPTKPSTSSSTVAATGSHSSTGSASPVYTPASSLPAISGNNVDKLHQVTRGTCGSVSGGWQLTGTIKNPSSDEVSYDILVYFTTTSATVINSAETVVKVKGGDTAPFTATKQFAGPPNMLCVIVSVK